jgi:hypothetical protein
MVSVKHNLFIRYLLLEWLIINKDTNFYPRVVNKINIAFTNDEKSLLNKCLKYNFSHKQKHWINYSAFEAETAITLLPTNEEEHLRYQVTQNIKKLQN